MTSTKLYTVQHEVKSRLLDLDIREEALRQVVEAGERARRKCTENHPRTAKGYWAWAEEVREMRDIMIPLGWTAQEFDGVPVVVHPLGKIAIAITSGDQGTGLDTESLHSKNPKGDATACLVASNAQQMSLFEDAEEGRKVLPFLKSEILTWYLVTRRDNEEVRSELSLPAGLANDSRMDTWVERILLSPLPIDGDKISIEPEEEQSEEIVVEISRKG